MKFAVVPIALLLAACTPSQAPENAVAQAAVPTATVASEVPAPKRGTDQDTHNPLQTFRALGTEPFWNVNVQGDQLTFIKPEDQVGVVMQGQRQAVAGGVDISGSNDGQPFSLRVRPGSCSDGMSDNEYAMTSSFSMGDRRYTGCAEAAK